MSKNLTEAGTARGSNPTPQAQPGNDRGSPAAGTSTVPGADLGYIELPKDVSDDGPSWRTHEGFRDKFLRKTKENPFVPIGLGLTIAALSYGLWQMKTGDRVMSQKMMRVRVAAQAFTVVALLTGVLYQSTKPKRSD